MADNRKYRVEGTPREIASAINEIDGNGVSFDKGANITLSKKEVLCMSQPFVIDTEKIVISMIFMFPMEATTEKLVK